MQSESTLYLVPTLVKKTSLPLPSSSSCSRSSSALFDCLFARCLLRGGPRKNANDKKEK
jgi:hypothetical protein